MTKGLSIPGAILEEDDENLLSWAPNITSLARDPLGVFELGRCDIACFPHHEFTLLADPHQAAQSEGLDDGSIADPAPLVLTVAPLLGTTQ